MLALLAVSITSERFLLAGVALTAIAAGIGAWRKIAMPRWAQALIIAGAFFLAIAAGGLMWARPRPQTIAVMVDVSPSTRGADFRDSEKLRSRVHQLVGDKPCRLFFFADRNHPADFSAPPAEIAVDRTIFTPIDAGPILLFSDARFDLPSQAPATYIVVDPELEDVQDSAVVQLQLRGQTAAAITVRAAEPKIVTLHGVTGPTTAPAPPGETVITRPLQSGENMVSAEIAGNDRWPENNAMTLRVSPPLASERWWIGAGAPAGWKAIAPADLPVDAAAYLAPSVIVLNNIGAETLSPATMDRLAQYSRDLGGSILLVGGNNAFSAGTYPGTALEDISPLASSPPEPTMVWMLLADSSGSMADDVGGGVSRWNLASGAIIKLLPQLPENDPVQVGQFSDVLHWWPVGKNARETSALPLPPADAAPHGPTNLEAALNRIAEQADGSMPRQLLVLSDCDARIDHPDSIIDAFKKKKITLHVLALGQGTGLPVIRQIVQATGGIVIEQFDPRQWADAVHKLMQAALPQRLMESPARVRFEDRAAGLPDVDASPWNRTWLKHGATPWATAQIGPEQIPMAGQWRIGRGQAAAIAFEASPQLADHLAGLIAMEPRDPRLNVTWEIGRQIRVTIDAVDHQAYLNNLNLTLEFDDGAAARIIPQVAPGKYQLSADAPRQPSIATVRRDNALVDRVAIAGRYAPEFDAIGNDHDAMRQLASQTGGAVIWPADHNAIDFHWPTQNVPLTPWIACLGALLIGAGLALWRIS